jgi:hypothetical protein
MAHKKRRNRLQFRRDTDYVFRFLIQPTALIAQSGCFSLFDNQISRQRAKGRVELVGRA